MKKFALIALFALCVAPAFAVSTQTVDVQVVVQSYTAVSVTSSSVGTISDQGVFDFGTTADGGQTGNWSSVDLHFSYQSNIPGFIIFTLTDNNPVVGETGNGLQFSLANATPRTITAGANQPDDYVTVNSNVNLATAPGTYQARLVISYVATLPTS